VMGSGFTKRVTKSSSIQNSHVAIFANFNKTFTMLVSRVIKTLSGFWFKRCFRDVIYEGVAFF
jgi:hypothetical protein